MHGPYLMPRPDAPPPGTGFMPARGRLGRWRDRAAVALMMRVFRTALPALNQARAELGLPPVRDLADVINAASRVLVCTSPGYDFAAGAVPVNVRYVGPQLDDDPDDTAGETWDDPGGRPLVLVGLSSTVMSHEQELLQRAAEALGQLPVRGLVTTGPAVNPAAIRAPANVSVRRWVRHADVLPYCSAVLTHGGHGTVIKALAAGVPLVVAPLGRDQPDNAARVVHAGAGLWVSKKAGVPALRDAIARTLDEPRYRAAARRMAATLAAERDEALVVDELERAALEGPALEAQPCHIRLPAIRHGGDQIGEKDMTRIAVAGATGRVGRHVVDVLNEGGHDVVAISRSNGVDVITGDGLAAALEGVEVVIDTSTGPSAEQGPATEFFLTATRNLEEEGVKAGVRRLVLVSIIGVDRSSGGYGAAKLAQERAVLAGPIPGRILRAAQFDEFVEVLMGWGGRATWFTCRRCAPRSSRPGPWPRRSWTWPCPRSRRARSPPRSPARARNTSRTWPSWSRPSAASRSRSRRSATRPTRTTRSTPTAACCPARTPRWPARPSPSGWKLTDRC